VDGDYDESVRKAHECSEKTPGGMLIEGTAFEGYKDVPRVSKISTSDCSAWPIKCRQSLKRTNQIVSFERTLHMRVIHNPGRDLFGFCLNQDLFGQRPQYTIDF
jgi:hypothetical protein